MKKFMMVLVLSLSITGINFSQENDAINVYTVFLNVVHEQFKFPLIGFVNIAAGSHNSPQIGFVNWNTKNLNMLQLGFINTVGGNMAGLQMGFINTVAGGMSGFQLGFVNTVVNHFTGLQLGFINTAVNKLDGSQVSFVNVAKRLNGLQLGFINYADTLEKGIPIGFLSIVRNGGYRAIEAGVSDIAPFNLSFKIGLEVFYTSFIISYNPFRDGIREQIIWGAGFGSIINLGKTFFINPEIMSHNAIGVNFQRYVSGIPYFGYKIIPRLSVVAGPSIVWASSDNRIEDSFYGIIRHSINDSNELYVGARMGVRLSR